eukprot:275055_1
MLIKIKTIQNRAYNLNIDSTVTVIDLKNAIHKQFQLGIPKTQKLIHHGKILKNDQSVQSIGFKENDILVVLIKKIRNQHITKNRSYEVSSPFTTNDHDHDFESFVYVHTLVFGFIRNASRCFNFEIPSDVKVICFEYLNLKIEYFQFIGQHQINNNKKIITNNTGEYKTVYGSIGISTSRNIKYFWKFKIISCQAIYIGIDQIRNNQCLFIDKRGIGFPGSKQRENYAYCSSGNICSHKLMNRPYDVVGYKKNDIVWMELNCWESNKFAVLSFGKQKNLLTKAFIDISRNKYFKMAITFRGNNFGKSSSAQLVTYFEQRELI